MTVRQAPEGITVRSKQHHYPVKAWKVTGNSHKRETRRVIFSKNAGGGAPVRLELHGETAALAEMFAEIAAALWGIDDSEPEPERRP